MIFGATPICILMATIGAGGIRSEAPSVNRYITKLQDLAATVEVTRLESSELEKIGRDFAPMYRLKHLSLLYKNPDLMRLDGSSRVFGTGTLVLNGTMRRYTVSKLGLKKTEDLKDSPGKRQSLLEFAGLLTEGTLKFLQPVFVKQDKIVDSECNVYDLKCTDNGGSYFRVWFDERTHLSLRREWFGSDGKKKATFRYIGAHEIKPGVWLPEKCEILNGDDMISAVLEYRDMKANEGVPDDKFTIAGQ